MFITKKSKTKSLMTVAALLVVSIPSSFCAEQFFRTTVTKLSSVRMPTVRSYSHKPNSHEFETWNTGFIPPSFKTEKFPVQGKKSSYWNQGFVVPSSERTLSSSFGQSATKLLKRNPEIQKSLADIKWHFDPVRALYYREEYVKVEGIEDDKRQNILASSIPIKKEDNTVEFSLKNTVEKKKM